MPHHVYHTRALVMRTIATGEADVVLDLFTQDWGRITAHARGLRRESSRLRYVLQPMSWVVINVVRGLGGWRVTTANPDHMPLSPEKGRASLARIVRIVQKFFPYEVSSEPVFRGLLWHSTMLMRDPGRAKDLEAMTLARIFQHLGYWGIDTYEDVLSPDTPSEEMLSPEARATLIKEINRILRTAQS